MNKDALISLAADIVAAHVSHNAVMVSDVPHLIQSVYQALLTADSPAPAVVEKREPAVPVRASVKPDAVTCLECGFKGKMLKRHLSTEHGLTAQDYRERWSLAADHPLVAPDYAARRAQLAKSFGLGRKSVEAAGG
jgi:predicted transcriptional regulator